MASLELAKENLKNASGIKTEFKSLQECKNNLLALDQKIGLPHISNEIDTLNYMNVIKSLGVWFIAAQTKSQSLKLLAPYVPLLLSVILARKNKV